MSYTPPSIDLTAFSCPYCNAYAAQKWMQGVGESMQLSPGTAPKPQNVWLQVDPNYPLKISSIGEPRGYIQAIQNLWISRCEHCSNMSIWVDQCLVFPTYKLGIQPNTDLPPDVLGDFQEARSILNLSPRGAAALLRLAVQKLCKHLGESGKSIDQDISSLVKKGLSPMLQQALDYVRVVGNNAVHPGEMALKDDTATAEQLLEVVNLIADQMITQPKAIQTLYNKLPEDKRKAIENRDNKGKP